MQPEALGAAEKATAPYGSWESPITAAAVSAAGRTVEGLAVAGDGRLVWVEKRPEEGGASVLVREAAEPRGKALDVSPQGFAVRTLAQEYGGGSGAFAVQGDTVVFSNYSDQRLYMQTIGDSSPRPLTPDYAASEVRYADGVFDPHFHRYVTIMEDHRNNSSDPVTTIAAVKTSDRDVNEPTILVSGNDFYAFPRVDPSEKRMAWIEWSNPNMSWDKSQLWVGYFSEKGEVQNRICIAGGDPTLVESPTEPKWSSKGELFFITDRQSGFWNIYKWDEQSNVVIQLYALDAEFSKPMWVFGASSYAFVGKNDSSLKIICCYRQNGRSYVGVLDPGSGSFSTLVIPFSSVTNIVSGDECFYIEGASANLPVSIAKCQVTLDEKRTVTTDFSLIWSSSEDVTEYKSYFSLPEFIEFPTVIPGQHAYAYFYAPYSHSFQGPSDEKPPLLVRTHGGPTEEARGILDLNVQYWTSRGWALVDVNYGGSSGYGREYRERILGQWGAVDVNDCCSCATFLVETGRVDGQRLCITGESAGGFTTLACLAFRQTFKAGCSLYGIADLTSLRAGSHKFEACYTDNLVGNKQAYDERAPINFVDKFTCPLILFHGLEDTVVPPDQTAKIYKAIKDKGLPVALVEYEGEPHGFRKAENIKFTLEQEMVFFARLVGKFKVAGDITPINIQNFD
ncbi:hypothetical protein PAHAL_4G253000 [Panicum hallii]|uniref:Peptidase S9 prolyl oligopeptidase catalytic domain-containing protein n=1 Tax=Panicum hallii TaxID=206008 RepID=A0A2T8JDV9_9POAL|nr:uncharacterized protein LOC112890291 isoform X3 [Panicum hallii]PVH48114.1 hypothetical protein PAHAL_4G253000 [Panicum hallii]